MHRQVDGDARAPDVLSEQPLFVGLLDGPADGPDVLHELAADVDVALLRADGVAGKDHPLDDLVRVDEHQLVVLERARLGLVGVADEVARLRGVFRHEAPLHAGGEPGAAPAAQSRVLDDFDEFVRGHPEGFVERAVAAVVEVRCDIGYAGDMVLAEDDLVSH